MQIFLEVMIFKAWNLSVWTNESLNLPSEVPVWGRALYNCWGRKAAQTLLNLLPQFCFEPISRKGARPVSHQTHKTHILRLGVFLCPHPHLTPLPPHLCTPLWQEGKMGPLLRAQEYGLRTRGPAFPSKPWPPPAMWPRTRHIICLGLSFLVYIFWEQK